MVDDESELIIQKTSKGWDALISKDIKGSLILTNKRIIIGKSENSIYLADIEHIEISTRFADVPKIMIIHDDKTDNIEFVRSSAGHSLSLFSGDLGRSFTHSELSSYTAYWASLLTMAVYLSGGQRFEENGGYVYKDREVWCGHCQKYVKVPYTDISVWKLECPECGHRGMVSKSPDD